MTPPPALGADLLAVVARLNRLANQRARIPLPFAQARLLSTIEDQGATRISDLAALDHCAQPTMTTQVRRLEDAGLVSRTADPGDARAVLIRITPKGARTLTQVRADRGAAIDPYLQRLDPRTGRRSPMRFASCVAFSRMRPPRIPPRNNRLGVTAAYVASAQSRELSTVEVPSATTKRTKSSAGGHALG